MIVTIFRNRLNPETEAEYGELAPRIAAIADAMPGFVSRKTFVADDGERVTIVEFEDEKTQRAWAMQADHVAAKKRGRQALYDEFKLQVCSVQRESVFTRPVVGA